MPSQNNTAPSLSATPLTVHPPHTPPVPAPSPRTSPHALRIGLAAGFGLTVALWLVQVELSTRLDALFATIAHLTGLLAGYGMLIMLLLMARVPLIEHGVGADRLTRWHARAGRSVLSLCAAHVVFALCGYTVYTATDLPTAAIDLLSYPALAIATVGTALVTAAGIFSARAIRTRVRHETWRALHLLTYVGVGLAFIHQLAGPDLESPLATWLWTLAHTTVAALLVWYRMIVPIRQALRHGLRVTEVRVEGPGVVSLVIQGRDLDALRAESGQFFRWRFLTRRLWRTALPFSLSAPPHENTLRITVKSCGDHTRRIRRLRPGVRVLATGPFGALTAHRRTRRRVLLLAGGVGITPLRALFETMPGGPGDLTLLYRARTADELVLRDELESIAAARGATLHYLLGRSDDPVNPLSPEALRNLVPDLRAHDVYLCGPPGMSGAAEAALSQAGVPASRIHSESFTY